MTEAYHLIRPILNSRLEADQKSVLLAIARDLEADVAHNVRLESLAIAARLDEGRAAAVLKSLTRRGGPLAVLPADDPLAAPSYRFRVDRLPT